MKENCCILSCGRHNKLTKPYFGYEDIARVLNISPNSAKVAASRYVKAGILLIQVPSYISLMTALGYYEITTQLQQDYIESVGVRRTKDITIEKTVFRYTKIKPELYSGFKRMRGFFIAEPEKAFVDALYLQSLGRRSIDTSSLDVDKLDWPMVLQISKSFPKSTRRLVKRYERFGKT